jgi:hypothetical protein
MSSGVVADPIGAIKEADERALKIIGIEKGTS